MSRFTASKPLRISVLLLAGVLVAAGFYQATRPAPQPPAEILPGGALLVLEAKDFSSLLAAWNGSTEKKTWLAGDNYKVFSRSRLFLRLEEVLNEFAAVGGFPADMALAESAAGDTAAFALYDIGKLEFLYVTHLPSARAANTVLWKSRAQFEPRSNAGFDYFVRVSEDKTRVIAFASTDDFLLVATREDLLASALALLAGKEGPKVRGEPWYTQAVAAAGEPGDLRLVMDLQNLARKPHFRSYWIQGNVSEIAAYRAGISDLYRSASEFREERVLLPAAPAAGDATAHYDEAVVAEASRFLPADAGLYRAWASPTTKDVIELLRQKLLAPQAGASVASKEAPETSLGSGEAGGHGDLETHIDEAPLVLGEGFAPAALTKILEGAQLRAMLHVQSSAPIAGQGFIGNHSAIVLVSSADWNQDAMREALGDAVESLWTASRLGVAWVEHKHDRRVYYFDGLARLAVAVDGPALVISDSPQLLAATLKGLSSSGDKAKSGAVYSAGFRHTRERENFYRMMRWMDYPSAASMGSSEGREPMFFSENMASLSRSLAGVDEVSMITHQEGDKTRQTVIYRLVPAENAAVRIFRRGTASAVP
ncbi:MAG: hypothetical protein ACREVR_15305 [Burkholderiales bacterium]